jgi:hypothetical protein
MSPLLVRMKLERPGVCPASARQGSWRAGILQYLLAGRAVATVDRQVDLEPGSLPPGLWTVIRVDDQPFQPTGQPVPVFRPHETLLEVSAAC